MPFSAFFVMATVIFLVALFAVSFAVVTVHEYFRARRLVRRMIAHSAKVQKARREIKLRALRLKEQKAADSETSDLYFAKWEEFINGLADGHSEDHETRG